MNTKDKQLITIGFPFGLYWEQLFSNNIYVRFINPFSFWHRYKIDHLETCYQLDIRQYLENCYQLKVKSPRLLNPRNISR